MKLITASVLILAVLKKNTMKAYIVQPANKDQMNLRRYKSLNVNQISKQMRQNMLDQRGTKDILLFFQKTRTLQSRGVVTLFHLFTIVYC